jgi:hypothetical protein
MESTKTDITASVSPQVRKPSLLDRLLYSAWYLEARAAVNQFVAYRSEVLRKLNRLLGGAR